MTNVVGLDTSALDGTFKEHAARGIGRYVRELKRYFDERQVAPSSPGDSQVDVDYFDHAAMVPDRAVSWLPAGRMTFKQQLLYPLRMGSTSKRRGFELFHFPAHMDAPSWCPARYILTVLDLIPLVCADLYKAERPGWRFALARWLELRAIRNADHIVAISQCTADDVHRLLGVPYERITVTPLGVDDRFFEAQLLDEQRIRKQYELPAGRPVMLYVGGIDPRKNALGLVSAFAEVCKARGQLGEEVPLLCMVGRIEQDRQYPKLIKAIKDHGVSEHVRLSGFVPDEDLLQLYALSRVFCFLSLYEGFGLPALEAMAAGVPVVCSERSAMPEVVADAGLLVDPEDQGQVVSAIMKVLEDDRLAASLSEAGVARARLFPWKRTGEATLAAYQKLVANS